MALDHLLVKGNILWLRKREDIDDIHLGGDYTERYVGFFDHPVVVLDADLIQGEVTVCGITSFDNTTLAIKHSTNAWLRAQYLPIAPSPPHPDEGRPLLHQEGKALHKPSYVCITSQKRVQDMVLEPCRRGKHGRLTPESLKILLEEVAGTEILNFVPVERFALPLISTPPTPQLNATNWVNRPSRPAGVHRERTISAISNDQARAIAKELVRMRAEREHVLAMPGSYPRTEPRLQPAYRQGSYGTVSPRLSERPRQARDPESLDRASQGPKPSIWSRISDFFTSTGSTHSAPPQRYYGPGMYRVEPVKGPSVLSIFLSLGLVVGIAGGTAYLSYIGLRALAHLIWSHIQGTWIEVFLSWMRTAGIWTGKAIVWVVKGVFSLAKVSAHWIRQHL